MASAVRAPAHAAALEVMCRAARAGQLAARELGALRDALRALRRRRASGYECTPQVPLRPAAQLRLLSAWLAPPPPAPARSNSQEKRLSIEVVNFCCLHRPRDTWKAHPQFLSLLAGAVLRVRAHLPAGAWQRSQLSGRCSGSSRTRAPRLPGLTSSSTRPWCVGVGGGKHAPPLRAGMAGLRQLA